MAHARRGAETTERTEQYLRTLRSLLAGVEPDRRDAVVADVRAYLDDALERGLEVDEVMAGLGPAEDVAREYLGEGAGPFLSGADAVVREAAPASALLLHRAALVLAVVTAVFVAFLLPGYTASGDGTENLSDALGLGPALLTLVPAALVGVALVVPARRRGAVGLAVAVLVTGLAVATASSLGLFLGPLVLLLWLAVLLPALQGRGLTRGARRAWRGVGAVLLLLPAAVVVGGHVSGSVEASAGLLVVAVVLAGLAVAYGWGRRVGYVLTAALGAALLALATVVGGMLVLGAWWFGGLWLALGVAALAAHDGVARTGAA